MITGAQVEAGGKTRTLYYLLREQDRLTILKFFYHPEHTKSTLFA